MKSIEAEQAEFSAEPQITIGRLGHREDRALRRTRPELSMPYARTGSTSSDGSSARAGSGPSSNARVPIATIARANFIVATRDDQINDRG